MRLTLFAGARDVAEKTYVKFSSSIYIKNKIEIFTRPDLQIILLLQFIRCCINIAIRFKPGLRPLGAPINENN